MAGRRVSRKPTLRDAVEYLLGVKRAFRDEPEKYDEFIQISKDVRAHRVDEDGGKARVKELMKGHQELLVGFNFFFPGAVIAIQPEAEEEIEDTWNLIHKLKASFQEDNPQEFESFEKIMKTFKEGNMSVKEMRKEILRLIRIIKI